MLVLLALISAQIRPKAILDIFAADWALTQRHTINLTAGIQKKM
jgi:hypothetical protein